MKDVINQYSKLKELNDSSAQIIYVGEQSDNVVCVTVRTRYEQICTVSSIQFDIYLLNRDMDIFEAHVGEMCCTAVCDLTFKKKQILKIEHIGISPQYQNSGYGSLLMSTMLDYIKDFKFDMIAGMISWRDVGNTQAKERLLHFYDKFGFAVVGDRIIKSVDEMRVKYEKKDV